MGRNMRTAIGLLFVMLLTRPAPCAQFGSGHKSEEQIARMTPDQRVEEYCEEGARHEFLSHLKYKGLLLEYLCQDGLKVIPQVVREIEAYDPTSSEEEAHNRFWHYYSAAFILTELDDRMFRVRVFPEGRRVIEAMKRLSEKLRMAQFESKGEMKRVMGQRYEMHLLYVNKLEKECIKDRLIQKALLKKYKIDLSDEDLSAFVKYLIEHAPYYPSWSKTDPDLQINPDPYYQAYLEYKAKRANPK